ncbi:hypothetical protein D9V86_03820 [Bacteroidetes/Chlorobi group bacterium ChocPot_Mid]|nr:MAG: hypothetical protein D9V86_03820 [Bacteroidetes/Chlorobi group bacterium ChocPot_Mid]
MKKAILVLFVLTTSLFAQLSGTYTVGTGGDYATLKAACDAINASTINGDCTFYIISDLTETVNVGLGKDPSPYTITFKPFTGTTPTITFTQVADNAGASGAWVIGVPNLTVTSASNYNLVSTRNIVIDGSNTVNGTTRDLSINTQSGINSNTYPIRIFGDADNITLKNLNVTANQSVSYAVLLTNRFFSPNNYVPDNVTVQNCNLTNTFGSTGQALAISNSGTPTAFPTGIVFRDNLLTARTRGIFLNYAGNTDIFGNEIHVNQTGTGSLSEGIMCNQIGDATTGGQTINIYNNRIIELKSANTNSGTFGIIGIYAQSRGNYNIYNNFITGIQNTSTGTPDGVYYGIGVATSATNGITANVYNNTVVATDLTNLTTATALVYSAFYLNISGTSGTRVANVKNNLFIQNENGFKCFTFKWFNTSTVTLTSDYNDLFASGTPIAKIGVAGTTEYDLLSNWQAGVLKDANSKSKAVNFVSSTDLHLTGASIGDNDLAGKYISSYTTDIDGDTRDLYYPYMGADEQSTKLSLLAVDGDLSDASYMTLATKQNSNAGF